MLPSRAGRISYWGDNMSLFHRIFLVLIICSGALGDAKRFYFERSQTAWDEEATSVTQHQFQQRINHDDPSDLREFSQRFYVDNQYANSFDSPVLFYFCGEGVCTPRALTGQMIEHAKKFKAVMVALEHRYYGKSQPFDKLTPENLRFLTIDLALKDAAAFQDYFSSDFGYTGKWVVIGGSYPGNLSAAFRMQYPQRTVGALASSAPVRAKENFEEYDAHVTQVAGPDCVKNLRRMVRAAESALKDPAQWLALKKAFEAESIHGDVDVLYLIADISAAAVQYGSKNAFCKSIETPDIIAGYSKFARDLYKSWKIKAVDFTFQNALSENPDDYLGGFAMRQWLYQSCTEYGYWQSAHHDPAKSSRSKRIDLAYHREACQKLFGLTVPANTSRTNSLYFHPLFLFSTTNILFTNGSDDPWSNLSLNAQSAQQNPGIDFFLIDGAAHCDDLRANAASDSVELKKSRSLFQKLVDQWLAPVKH